MRELELHAGFSCKYIIVQEGGRLKKIEDDGLRT